MTAESALQLMNFPHIAVTLIQKTEATHTQDSPPYMYCPVHTAAVIAAPPPTPKCCVFAACEGHFHAHV